MNICDCLISNKNKVRENVEELQLKSDDYKGMRVKHNFSGMNICNHFGFRSN